VGKVSTIVAADPGGDGRRTRVGTGGGPAFWLMAITRGTVTAFHRRPSVTDQHFPKGSAIG
jgi:hypothetical protein